MSANWSVRLAYGFQVDTDELEKNIDPYDDLCQDFVSTVPERYPLLDVDFSGNMFSGDGVETWVVIKDSMFSVNDWTATLDLEKLKPFMDDSPALEQLWQFVDDTGIAFGNLEWRLKLYCG